MPSPTEITESTSYQLQVAQPLTEAQKSNLELVCTLYANVDLIVGYLDEISVRLPPKFIAETKRMIGESIDPNKTYEEFLDWLEEDLPAARNIRDMIQILSMKL